MHTEARGLRRPAAAAYLGISPSQFDKLRKAGKVPAPRELFGVILWDRADLDSLFDKPRYTAANDNYWDTALAAAS